MAKIPARLPVREIPGLTRVHTGKVRDTFTSPGRPDLLFPVASDRVSIFDFVLSGLVPQKGQILTALNVFWRIGLLKGLCEHDLCAYGSQLSEFISADDVDLLARTLAVRKKEMLPVEAIVRGYLTGSGLNAYNQSKEVCGHKLPDGLNDGSRLPYPIFTPTTKAEEGHDEHITADSVVDKHGQTVERLSLQLYQTLAAFALQRGIILADTKFELFAGGLADEVGTPDSSRFWDLKGWIKSQAAGKSPDSLDKQYVREWGKALGIHKRDPLAPEDVAWVHTQVVPKNVLSRTTEIYRYIFWRLTGQKLEVFQSQVMGLPVSPAKVKLEVVVGSESDLPQMQAGLAWLAGAKNAVETRVNVISCHRNPETLRQFATKLDPSAVVVAGAGMAAQLPGVLKGWLDHFSNPAPVLGVGFEGVTDRAGRAARLSIEELPGQPVMLDPEGHAYFGAEGFLTACKSAVYDEFLRDLRNNSKEPKLGMRLRLDGSLKF